MAQRGDDEIQKKKKKIVYRTATHPYGRNRSVLGVARSVKFKLFAGETEISETGFPVSPKKDAWNYKVKRI